MEGGVVGCVSRTIECLLILSVDLVCLHAFCTENNVQSEPTH